MTETASVITKMTPSRMGEAGGGDLRRTGGHDSRSHPPSNTNWSDATENKSVTCPHREGLKWMLGMQRTGIPTIFHSRRQGAHQPRCKSYFKATFRPPSLHNRNLSCQCISRGRLNLINRGFPEAPTGRHHPGNFRLNTKACRDMENPDGAVLVGK